MYITEEKNEKGFDENFIDSIIRPRLYSSVISRDFLFCYDKNLNLSSDKNIIETKNSKLENPKRDTRGDNGVNKKGSDFVLIDLLDNNKHKNFEGKSLIENKKNNINNPLLKNNITRIFNNKSLVIDRKNKNTKGLKK